MFEKGYIGSSGAVIRGLDKAILIHIDMEFKAIGACTFAIVALELVAVIVSVVYLFLTSISWCGSYEMYSR
ncbi:MAG: hypothetical protein KAG53_03445 [Endozoicomonadaceae bacterium]|nr:hypothetical protein [Endozoicomonadaceae bacterium]